ncbi:MAG: hypothetical protein ACRC1T_09760 [Clostridium chrysemydis]|uniref:hypothetical protein n=1 Tax=Clostridium chrysemydis TaxID=2665504 RepID=UPI003F355BC9
MKNILNELKEIYVKEKENMDVLMNEFNRSGLNTYSEEYCCYMEKISHIDGELNGLSHSFDLIAKSMNLISKKIIKLQNPITLECFIEVKNDIVTTSKIKNIMVGEKIDSDKIIEICAKNNLIMSINAEYVNIDEYEIKDSVK